MNRETRNKLIRLAHDKPELRSKILPLLKTAGEFTEQEWKTHKEKHPNADPKDHTITKGDGGKGSGGGGSKAKSKSFMHPEDYEDAQEAAMHVDMDDVGEDVPALRGFWNTSADSYYKPTTRDRLEHAGKLFGLSEKQIQGHLDHRDGDRGPGVEKVVGFTSAFQALNRVMGKLFNEGGSSVEGDLEDFTSAFHYWVGDEDAIYETMGWSRGGADPGNVKRNTVKMVTKAVKTIQKQIAETTNIDISKGAYDMEWKDADAKREVEKKPEAEKKEEKSEKKQKGGPKKEKSKAELLKDYKDAIQKSKMSPEDKKKALEKANQPNFDPGAALGAMGEDEDEGESKQASDKDNAKALLEVDEVAEAGGEKSKPEDLKRPPKKKKASLRTRLIRLAFENPHLRSKILPALTHKTAAGKARAEIHGNSVYFFQPVDYKKSRITGFWATERTLKHNWNELLDTVQAALKALKRHKVISISDLTLAPPTQGVQLAFKTNSPPEVWASLSWDTVYPRKDESLPYQEEVKPLHREEYLPAIIKALESIGLRVMVK